MSSSLAHVAYILQCPFHGKIIARDEQGNPTDPTDIAQLAEKKLKESKEGNVDWEDPELQADIQLQTGIQLVRQKKGKGLLVTVHGRRMLLHYLCPLNVEANILISRFL